MKSLNNREIFRISEDKAKKLSKNTVVKTRLFWFLPQYCHPREEGKQTLGTELKDPIGIKISGTNQVLPAGFITVHCDENTFLMPCKKKLID